MEHQEQQLPEPAPLKIQIMNAISATIANIEWEMENDIYNNEYKELLKEKISSYNAQLALANELTYHPFLKIHRELLQKRRTLLTGAILSQHNDHDFYDSQ